MKSPLTVLWYTNTMLANATIRYTWRWTHRFKVTEWAWRHMFASIWEFRAVKVVACLHRSTVKWRVTNRRYGIYYIDCTQKMILIQMLTSGCWFAIVRENHCCSESPSAKDRVANVRSGPGSWSIDKTVVIARSSGGLCWGRHKWQTATR